MTFESIQNEYVRSIAFLYSKSTLILLTKNGVPFTSHGEN